MALTVSGYSLPSGVTNRAQIKQIQNQLGVTADGVWGPKTQAAYDRTNNTASPSMYPDATFEGYYNSILSNLNGGGNYVNYQMPSVDELSSRIEGYLRPAYDQAIAQRQQQTKQYSANLDVDAASRGMGRSSYVTDAKSKQQNAEAADIANLESNYGAALSEALLNQYNQHMNNKLNVDTLNAQLRAQYEQTAYERAADMYSLMNAQKKTGGKGGNSYNLYDLAKQEVYRTDPTTSDTDLARSAYQLLRDGDVMYALTGGKYTAEELRGSIEQARNDYLAGYEKKAADLNKKNNASAEKNQGR